MIFHVGFRVEGLGLFGPGALAKRLSFKGVQVTVLDLGLGCRECTG